MGGRSIVLGGTVGVDRGILVSTNNTALAHTNLADGDQARYYVLGEVLPDACKKSFTDPTPSNPNGAIVVTLGNVPNATAPDNPATSYGFVRFRVRVK